MTHLAWYPRMRPWIHKRPTSCSCTNGVFKDPEVIHSGHATSYPNERHKKKDTKPEPWHLFGHDELSTHSIILAKAFVFYTNFTNDAKRTRISPSSTARLSSTQ